MAKVRFTNGKEMTLPPEKATAIWEVLNGEIEGTQEQQDFCMKVSKIYLNWRNAPDSYIRDRFEYIAPMVINEWMVQVRDLGDSRRTSDGIPSRPEPGAVVNREFSKKWGLLRNGVATSLARQYFNNGRTVSVQGTRGISQGMYEAIPAHDR